MSNPVVYDKTSWHYPDGHGCPSLEAAKRHLQILMDWLHEEGLLNDYGLEIYEIGVDEDFALTSDMLTNRGNAILELCYADWLKTVDYEHLPSTTILERHLKD